MTARTVVAISSLVCGLAASGCLKFYDVPVEIPVQAKIDVSKFQRVLVAGFLSGGARAIDPNTETARLLRSQLRNKQDLRVIDADVLSLVEEVDRRRGTPAARPSAEPKVLNDAEIKDYEQIFSDEGFWKQVAADYDGPLIVTGSVLFAEVSKSGMVTKPQAFVDPQSGQESYRSVMEYSDLKGYALTPKFVFIDGRTGKELYSETYHEEALYASGQNTPALSSYFEMMDKLLPSFLNTLSSQKIKGTRTLLK
ncbi:MAG: hypothetical protein IT184_13950 [Acidobacteria bacterium]|nr:hypothetical protein [Acidobacteriota bacterium]